MCIGGGIEIVITYKCTLDNTRIRTYTLPLALPMWSTAYHYYSSVSTCAGVRVCVSVFVYLVNVFSFVQVSV